MGQADATPEHEAGGWASHKHVGSRQAKAEPDAVDAEIDSASIEP